jgi:GMP synthase-like glutamine amidotransferase
VKPALIRRHGDSAPPGLLIEWLDERGIPYEISESWRGNGRPDPRDHAFVASLGSHHNPRDTHEPAVVAELELLRTAVEHDVPVLGLCYGGQALAAVLGGEIIRTERPELGWVEIESDDPDLVPTGPWLEWHYDRFTTPPQAQEIARNAHSTQAFVQGPHLGVQFHPESTIEIVTGWARKDAPRLHELGIHDGETRLAVAEERKSAARAAAFRLFDAFVARRRT